MTTKFLVYNVAENKQEETATLEEAFALRESLTQEMVDKYKTSVLQNHAITTVNISEDGSETWVAINEQL
jgi:hypothetical protein